MLLSLVCFFGSPICKWEVVDDNLCMWSCGWVVVDEERQMRSFGWGICGWLVQMRNCGWEIVDEKNEKLWISEWGIVGEALWRRNIDEKILPAVVGHGGGGGSIWKGRCCSVGQLWNGILSLGQMFPNIIWDLLMVWTVFGLGWFWPTNHMIISKG